MLSHIVAASENNIIGIKNGLPWKLPDDFKYFKNKTWSMPVIMGRNTFESLKKDLPGRINIVVTTKTDWHPKNVFIANDISEAIEKAKESEASEIFINGGGAIFTPPFDIIDRIYLTRVHTTVAGDTYYPEMDKSTWKRIKEDAFPADSKNNYPFTFEIWERVNQ